MVKQNVGCDFGFRGLAALSEESATPKRDASKSRKQNL
jgi:hypothetical protein